MMLQVNWHNPYSTTRIPVFARNTVASSHPLATQAGLSMLAAGGSAVDAAIATAAMLTVVEPVSCGLGGDAFALLWQSGRLHGLNASGTAPSAWNLEYFRERYGENERGWVKRPQRGWDSVTIPGVVAGWQALHARGGRLKFGDLMAPSIRIAEAGFAVTPVVAHKWAAAVPELASQPGYAVTFMPGGRAPRAGEWFKSPAHAQSLRRLAEHGASDFYLGELGEKIVAAAKAGDAALTLDDLAGYRTEWVEPIAHPYRGCRVHEMPPNGQGLAALIALGIYEHFDFSSKGPDDVDAHHVQIEAMKLAFADSYEHVADSRFMHVRPERFLDPAYLAGRAALIDMRSAGRFPSGFPRREGTVYLATADEHGQMVSFIQSNYMGFGSGVVVPETGIALQNRGVGFSSDPRSANVVAGGKRPFHTVIPAFLTRGAESAMAFGVMGGDMQPQGHLQTVVRMLDHGQQPQAACDAPRWRVNRNGTVSVESHMDPKLQQGLLDRGHNLQAVEDSYMDFGSGQFIARLDDDPSHGYVAASDARRDGQAAGF